MNINRKHIIILLILIGAIFIVCAVSAQGVSAAKTSKTTVKIYNFKSGVSWAPKAIKLNNGDAIAGYVEYEDNKQYDKGTGVVAWYAGSDGEDIDSHHTKIVKTKFFFKNKSTGEKLKKKVNGTKTDLIDGFTPYKAKVWYEVV